jgi:hypothetical protein
VPSSRPWRRGDLWPHGVRDGELPPLLPGRPGWVRDVPGFLRSLPPLISRVFAIMGPQIAGQINMDSRWPRIDQSYARLGCGRERRLSVAAHRATWRAAGFLLEVQDARDDDVIGFADIIPRSTYTLDEAFDEAAAGPLPPRVCDLCGVETQCECMCGLPYCGRACQRADRAKHEGHCDLIAANNEATYAATRIWWHMQGVRVEYEPS